MDWWTGGLTSPKINPKWTGDWYWFHLKWIGEYAVGYRKNESLYIVYDVGFEKYEWDNEIWVSLICKVSRFT